MTAASHPQASKGTVLEVERAMENFSTISANLLTSYNALEARAQRVEQELAVANQALKAKVAELDAVLEALPVGVAVRGADGRVRRVNQHLIETLRRPADELVGQREIAELTTARTHDGQVTTTDGRALHLDLRRSTVTSADTIIGSVEIVDDRTELQALTERVHAMDKIAALGTMAGGIAHEIRNPLNAVAGFAELLQTRLADHADPKVARWSMLIAQGAGEANAIISSLLSLSQPEPLEREQIEPAELLTEALRAANREHAVEVRCTAPAFVGDRIKLRQALRNLIANATDVAPTAPLIVEARIEAGLLELAVSDAGPGIAPELRRRVLDPFYTTRAEGCGLGLALTNTIADLHGGRLYIDPAASELGGARVSLQLPLVSHR